MTASRRSALFLLILGGIAAAIVAYDLRRPSAPIQTEPPAAPEAEPAGLVSRRLLDKGPLLYEGEYLQNLLDRVGPALVWARPTNVPGAPDSSGFFITATGDIVISLTSASAEWHVHSPSGDFPTARLVGADAVHGLALLRVSLAESVTPLVFAAEAEGVVPSLVGLRLTRTVPEARLIAQPGTMSALQQRLATGDVRPGEAVVDLDGRITAFGVPQVHGIEVLTAPLIREIVSSLQATGRHRHPWTGLDLQTITAGLRAHFPSGTFVAVHVEPGSPAAEAGIEAGTVFSRATIRDRVAITAEELAGLAVVGAEIQLTVEPSTLRRRRPERYTLTVQDRQAPLPFAPELDFGVRPEGPAGGVRLLVAPGSLAATHGLMTGDLVTAIDLRPVTAERQLSQAMASDAPRLLTVRRGTDHFFVLLDGGSDDEGSS